MTRLYIHQPPETPTSVPDIADSVSRAHREVLSPFVLPYHPSDRRQSSGPR